MRIRDDHRSPGMARTDRRRLLETGGILAGAAALLGAAGPSASGEAKVRRRQRRGPFRVFVISTAYGGILALLLAGPALSAVRMGTDGNDTLVGTAANDQLTGKGGNDSLKGKTGNDRYIFADNWGTDTLVEKPGEGSDTVDFHAVAGGPVSISLVPESADGNPTANGNGATGPNGDVRFAYEVNGQTIQSTVENAIGGRGDGDLIIGGAGKNVLQPGGGANDIFLDLGGANDGAGDSLDLPASDDVYTGFATNTGTDFVQDFGGNGDVLDLRPYATGDVFVTAIDFDQNPDTIESLQIVTGLTGQIIIVGQFGDVSNITTDFNYHGHIETIRFANKTFSTSSALRSATVASTEALSGKQVRLVEAAEGLAEEARVLIDLKDPLRLLRVSSDQRSQGGADTSRAEKQHRNGKHRKHEH